MIEGKDVKKRAEFSVDFFIKNENSKSPLIFGVVVQGESADRTVIYPVRGNNANLAENKIDVLDIKTQEQIIDRLESRIAEEKPEFIVIDITDHGKPVFEHLKKFHESLYCKVVGINPTAVFENTLYTNWHSCMHSHLKEKLMDRQIDTPADSKLIEELGSFQFRTVKGRLLVNSKNDILERIGRFPDRADALALTQVVQRQIQPHKGVSTVNRLVD